MSHEDNAAQLLAAAQSFQAEVTTNSVALDKEAADIVQGEAARAVQAIERAKAKLSQPSEPISERGDDDTGSCEAEDHSDWLHLSSLSLDLSALIEQAHLASWMPNLSITTPELTALPSSLIGSGYTSLSVRACPALTHAGAYPKGLVFLNYEACPELASFASPVPATLETFEVSGTTLLTQLPSLFFTKLKELVVINCTLLRELPDLPDTLESLDLSGCTGLDQNSTMLAILKLLTKGRCSDVQTPWASVKGKTLDLSGCDKLNRDNTKRLLLSLTVQSFKVTQPKHWKQNSSPLIDLTNNKKRFDQLKA